MQYKFVTERLNYDCYASGKVFYSFPGLPAFPIRLASEIFLQCKAIAKWESPCTLYDPCCGSAYGLAVLGYLNPESIGSILASDVSEEVLAAAKRNLSLLSVTGLERRIGELEGYIAAYDKPSHKEALACALEFKRQLATVPLPIKTGSFLANATSHSDLQCHLRDANIDLVFTDIPHGRMASWQGMAGSANPVGGMLTALSDFLRDDSLVVIAASKAEKIQSAEFECIKQFKAGLRRIVILRKKG